MAAPAFSTSKSASVTTTNSSGAQTAFEHQGGRVFLAGHGTWNSVTTLLEMTLDGTNWFASGIALTADGITSAILPPCTLRHNRSGGNIGASVTAIAHV